MAGSSACFHSQPLDLTWIASAFAVGVFRKYPSNSSAARSAWPLNS